MIVLAPGTPKYLLIDTAEHARNAERLTRQAPVGVVAEVQPDGSVKLHRGYHVLAPNGGVYLVADRDPLFSTRLQPHYPDVQVRSGFCTYGEVRIAEYAGEDLSATPPPPAAAPAASVKTNPAKTKPAIKKETSEPNGEE